MALDDSNIARPAMADSTISTNDGGGGYDLAAELGLTASEVAELSAMPGRPRSGQDARFFGGNWTTASRETSGPPVQVVTIHPDGDNSTAWAVPHLDRYGLGRGRS